MAKTKKSSKKTELAEYIVLYDYCDKDSYPSVLGKVCTLSEAQYAAAGEDNCVIAKVMYTVSTKTVLEEFNPNIGVKS